MRYIPEGINRAITMQGIPTSDILTAASEPGAQQASFLELFKHMQPVERGQIAFALAALTRLQQDSVIEPN